MDKRVLLGRQVVQDQLEQQAQLGKMVRQGQLAPRERQVIWGQQGTQAPRDQQVLQVLPVLPAHLVQQGVPVLQGLRVLREQLV